MYQALLHSAKNSMNALKKRIGSRIGSRGGTNILNASTPFFEVDVQLMPPRVLLSPSLHEIQDYINRSALAILSCYRTVVDWGYANVPAEKQAKHIELVHVALLLTGCIQGIRNTVAEYFNSFAKVRSVICTVALILDTHQEWAIRQSILTVTPAPPSFFASLSSPRQS